MIRLSAFLAALLAGAIALSAAAAQAAAPAVQVPREGYALQAHAAGDGDTVVVFESGFGQGVDAWDVVIASLGGACRCIAYRRAGVGELGDARTARLVDAHVQDLAAVLDALAPGQQAVIVGHSYGGLLATEFARRHPQRVAGLVLVDPATLSQRHAYLQADRARVLADDATLLGLLPPALGAEYRALVAQLDAAPPVEAALPDVPVILLTATSIADEPFVFEESAAGKLIWKRQHAALFAGAVRGRHQYVATSHDLHGEQPAVVVEAIRALIGRP